MSSSFVNGSGVMRGSEQNKKQSFKRRLLQALGLDADCGWWVGVRNDRRSRCRHVGRAFENSCELLESRALMATLAMGDVAFTGYQATAPDKISFVLLKQVDSGTVLTISDNAWSGTALGTTEGTSVLTFGATFSAGTQFNYDATRTAGAKWAVGTSSAGLSDTTSTNFSLNASGDNLFAYNGSVAPSSGTDANWVAALASNAFVASGGATTASLTQLPGAFTLGDTAFSLGLANGAANENGAMTTPTTVSGTVPQIRAIVNTNANWQTFIAADGQAIPPAITFSVTTTGGSNNAPTDLALSNSSIAENAGANATVGTLTTADPDIGNTFTYSLVAGTGSTDNASFSISGNTLRAVNSFDFETKSSYSIRVRTIDQGGLSFDKAFTISIVDINETTNIRLNELKVNPPGSTSTGDKYQYIELSGTAGASLTNVYIVMLDGNGATAGTAGYVLNLTGQALGSNGLLMVKSPTGGHAAASGTTVVTDTKFDTTGGILSKNTVSFYVASASSAFVQGTDYDSNNDGVLDNLPAGFSIFDNVGWSDGDSGDFVYGGVALTQTQGTPDAATRIVGNTNISASAWFNGDLYDVGNDPTQLLYDSTRASANLPTAPLVASLTPGAINFEQTATSTTLRMVSYNITASGSAPRTGLDTILQAIGSEVVAGFSKRIDVLFLQEVIASSTSAVATLLNNTYSTVAYATGSLVGATTGAGTQGVVYNSQSVSLIGEKLVGTANGTGQPRQTVRHQFRPVGTSGTSDFYVYNGHWKSANDATSEGRRQVEAQAIRADADALGQGAHILYVGDFNTYSSSDNGFQTLLTAGNGQAFDPVNRLGNWSGTSSFRDVFTQAPSNTPPSGLTGGGLDDRFDFQVMSGEFLDGSGLDYKTGSYHTFGNNGSVALNGNINDTSNTALAGLANRTTVLDLLTTVSDHLPVVADYTLPIVSAANQAPSGADKTITVSEDSTYTFATTDFGFTDNNTPANTLLAVKISTLPSAGSLTLNGTAVTAGQFVSASDITAGNLRFAPAANANGTGYSAFTFQVQDNGGTASGGIDLDPTANTITFNVTAVNDSPTLTASTGTTTYTGTALAIDAGLAVSDIDSVNLSGATVSITTNFTAAEDLLSFTNANGITGAFSASTGVLTLSGTASVANYQAALRSVTYSNSNSNPNSANRTIAFQVNDGSSANNLSNVVTKTVAVASGTSAQPLFIASNAVVPNSSGVSVTFNRPVDPTKINLYDQGGSLGTSDVTLVGTNTGPVRGSIVFNSTNTGFTFIKTGALTTGAGPGAELGILAADTYTLTLRSDATSGFVDTAGNALRDISGSAVGNYVKTFTVNAPAAGTVTIGVPDFARGFGQTIRIPNTATGLPVVISNGNNISGVNFTVNYDPALLNITGFTSLVAGATANVNISTPGKAIIEVFSLSAFATIDGPLVIGEFAATVPDTAPLGAKQIIRLTNVLAADATPQVNDVPAIGDNAIQVSGFFGDLNADRAYTSGDTTLLGRAGVGTNSGFTAFQQADPFIVGDMNSSMSFSSADQTILGRQSVGVTQAVIPALPSGITPPAPSGLDPRMFIPRDLTATDVDTATAGIQVDIPISVTVTEAQV